MVKFCIEEGCSLHPSFGYEGKNAICCFSHKTNEMTRCGKPICNYEGCKKTCRFNFPNEKKPLFCATHKQDGMINLSVKIKCSFEGCNKIPSYNFEGKNAERCSEHKLEGMVDVAHRICAHKDCRTIPTYNFEGIKTPKFCFSHKDDGMVVVVSKKICQYEGCDTNPIYNYSSEKKPVRCVKHKLEGMVDISHHKCIHPNCEKRPSHNFYYEKKPMYCSSHKLLNMCDVAHKTCKNDWCSTVVTMNKYDGYCPRCYVYMFPETKISTNFKTKELSVCGFVKTHFSDFTWTHDRKIQDGCSKRRPDLFLDLGYQVIIVEVDEEQHIDYNSSCENKRLMELSLDVGHRPIIFIRFNPDKYKSGNTLISSCWHQNNKGTLVIKKTKNDEWNERLNKLKNEIEFWTNPNNVSDKTVHITKLFYDE